MLSFAMQQYLGDTEHTEQKKLSVEISIGKQREDPELSRGETKEHQEKRDRLWEGNG